jgi:hypothetical protein
MIVHTCPAFSTLTATLDLPCSVSALDNVVEKSAARKLFEARGSDASGLRPHAAAGSTPAALVGWHVTSLM